MALTPKRQAFVEAYLQSSAEWFEGKSRVRNSYLNASQAARAAGYAHPGQEGHRLLKIPEIQKAIADRMREIETRTEQLVLREYDVATGDMSDFAEVFEEVSVPRMLRRAKELGLGHLIKKIKQTDQGVEIQLYDAHDARRMLGQRLNLWSDEEQKFDVTKLPPILLNIMGANAQELLESLDRLRDMHAKARAG